MHLSNPEHKMEDGFENGLVTGVVFMDLAAAYDTVNHRILHEKISPLTT